MSETAQSSPKIEESAREQASLSDTGQTQTEHTVLSKHYHCIEKLGQGAQAIMLKALDARNHPVAIKVFDFGSAGGWKDFDLFEREIEILKTLNIDGVPQYIETIKTDQKLYLVEEYIDAPSLENQIKAGRRFTASECESILKNAAKILQKLSEHIPPIIHRDIKPANLLVDKNLKVYLVDFGVVAKTTQTLSTTFAGTAGYVSPEQIYGKTTPASDIYSLGATMLHLISHVAPCNMQLNGITPDFDKYIPDSVPSWLSKTIKKMMSINPYERPQTGGELMAWIDKVKSERSQSESHVNSQSHSLDNNDDDDSLDDTDDDNSLDDTDDDQSSPVFLVKRYRRYERKASALTKGMIICLILVIVSGVLYLSSFRYFGNGMEFISQTLFGGAFIVFLICAFILAHYEDRNGHLLSLPGLVDVNKELVEKALKGDALSQHFIGHKYEFGDGAVQDERVAFAWYAISAKGGCAEAQAKIDE